MKIKALTRSEPLPKSGCRKKIRVQRRSGCRFFEHENQGAKNIRAFAKIRVQEENQGVERKSGRREKIRAQRENQGAGRESGRREKIRVQRKSECREKIRVQRKSERREKIRVQGENQGAGRKSGCRKKIRVQKENQGVGRKSGRREKIRVQREDQSIDVLNIKIRVQRKSGCKFFQHENQGAEKIRVKRELECKRRRTYIGSWYRVQLISVLSISLVYSLRRIYLISLMVAIRYQFY